MIVFTLGSDSGFQIGADGILDDYDDESGISVVLWCIIFVFLLVVTIWFYVTQLTPRSVKCVDDEDVEDEEERVANKLLNHLGAGKSNYNFKPSSSNKENDICRPSTSSQNPDNYEVIDGEIRIHHSSYEWQDESSSKSKGNESGVQEMSDSLVRRPSMEEMSLIFPGFLPSITEEEEEEENQENNCKEEDLFDPSVCKITSIEGDIVESCPNTSPDSKVYEPSADVHSTVNNSDVKNLDQREESSKLVYGKDISGRQITNRKGKQPAQTSRVTAEIRLRTQNLSQVCVVSSKGDKSVHDETVQASKPSGSGPKESDVNENKVSVLKTEKTSAYSSQNTKSFSSISGSKTHKFDPMDKSLGSNTSRDGIEANEKAVPAGRKDFKADKNSRELLEDAKNELSISASLNSNCYVNRNSNEENVCIETSYTNLQSEPDRDLNKPEEENNKKSEESSAGCISKKIDPSLSDGLKNTTFKDSNNMSNHLTHAWTFYSVLESTNNVNEINGDHKESNSLIEKQDQTQEIPTIVVDSYEERKISPNNINLENGNWTQLDGQIDSFETDIDVDELDLEDESEGNESEGELNMFLKRHVSVTDLDKVLSSNENAQDEDDFETEKNESEPAEDGNLETMMRGINISEANKPVYTESSLDDIWDDDELAKNGAVEQSVIETSEETSKTCSSENDSRYNSGTKSEFFSRQSVWTTLDQITDNSTKVKEDNTDWEKQTKYQTEDKRTENVVDATGLSKKIISSEKVEKKMDRKTKDGVSDDADTEKNDDYSEVRSLKEKIPDLMRGSEEESISSGQITINEFKVVEVSESCEQVNKSVRTFHDGEKRKTTGVEKLNRYVYGEVMLEPVTSQNKDSSQKINKTIADKQECAGEFGSSELLERTKPESTIQDSSSTEVKGIPELRKTEVLESIVVKDLESKVVVADETTKKRLESGSVLDGRKENGKKVEQGSGHIDLIRPVSPRRRDDVIYGRRKTKKDGSGKRAEFILRLNGSSRNREQGTSPYTSDSDDSIVSRNSTASDVTTTLSADQTFEDGVNLRGEHLPKAIKEDKHSDVTQSSHEVRYSTTMPSDKGINKSSTSIDSTTQIINEVTAQEGATVVTQSSATIEPEVNQPLESAELPSGKNESGATERQDDSDRGSVTYEEEDANRNYRVKRRDVQPKFEKSFVLNPEKKELQTLITIDQVPDTHIGLKICMTGRLDIEQKKTITGLEKAEQIVANRMKRIEAEKKAAEERKGKEKVDEEASKETKSRKDYVPRKARYDETRYRRTDRGRNTGMPVDERITPDEPITRKIQWNDFKLDDVLLEEINASEKYKRNDGSDDIDFHISDYEHKPNIKKVGSAEQMVTEDVISETFSPREIDWTLLELCDKKSDKKEIAENNNGIAVVSSSGKKKEETFYSNLDSDVSKYKDKYREISLDTDERKESTKVIALEKLSTPNLQKDIPSKKSSLMESSTAHVQENKEDANKQEQYNQKTRLDLDRKKRSDVLKKKISDKLSNMDLEVDESEDQASTVSTPSSEPDFPVRLTKSFSELRSMDKEKHEAGISRSNERISDLQSPRDPGVSTSEDDEVFSDSQGKVFKTKVTVEEVRGNKRRITILNIRKKSPGSTRWKSLNDIDSLSTVQKQIFKFTSVSSMPDEDKGPQVSPDASQSSKVNETIFAVSGLSPTDELDSANKSEEKRPKTTPSKAPQESYGGRITSSEENFIPSANGIQESDLRHKDNRMEDKDTKARSISPKETMFVASPQSPTPSSDTGYHSKDEKTGLQRQSSLSPVTVQASQSSPTGRIFALSRHSPTPLSDSERKTRENVPLQRQPSLSPETVQTSRKSPTGTIFALSRHSPTPISDSEKRRKEKSSREEKTVARNTSLEKQSSTERSSRHGGSRKGTFFAVSRYSPASSDTENQGPKVQPKYQASGPSAKAPAAPIRSSSKYLEERSSKDDSVRRSQDQQLRKGLQETLRPKVHEKINETRKEEMESAPRKTTKKETTFPVSGKEPTSSERREIWRTEESSSSSTLTKLSSPDDSHEKDSTRVSSDSDGEYRITRDGWLEKIGRTSSSSNSDIDQQNKVVKVTNLDSLISGVTSSESVKKSEVLENSQTTSLETSVTNEYSHNGSNSKSSALLPSSTKLQSSQHTRITSTGVQETDLDALFDDEEPEDSAPVQKATTEETVESRTSLLRKTVVNRSDKILVTEENYVTSVKQQPVEAVPVTIREADKSQDAPVVIKAIPLNESPAFGDLDDEVFTRFPEKHGVHQNGYRADGTCSSDADSETSSLNSVPLKPKSRHTRSSLEAVKTSIRPLRSSLSSDSSSAAATPIPSERSDTEFDTFNSLPSSTSTPDRNKRNYPEKSFRVSRKATKESGHHMRQITAEGDGLQIDSSDGAAQRITRAYSESLMGATESRRSAFTPVRNREKERSNSQDNILSKIPDEQDAIRYNDIGSDLNTEPSFKEMVDSHKSMPDLHKPHSESDAQTQNVPYHSRLSAHTRLWLSQTAGIDTSDLCKDDSFGSEIFLFPSNRFQPGKSVDASFLSIASDTDDVEDDVSTRPSSPMSEFSFAGEAPFGGDYQGDVIVVTCGNHHCGKDEIVRSQDKTSFTSCPSCFTYYCSSECRRAHWREHKKFCYFGRINSYMRSFVYFCHKKENLNLLLSKIATKNFSSRGRGCVMATFASPKQARKFMTSGCVLLPSPPSFSTVRELQQEGVVSKHKVNLIQQVKDYDPYQELVLNLAIVAGKVDDLPLYPVPRHKLSTVLQCIRIPLSESLIQRPKPVIPDTNRETKVFYLPKCSRHEFVNDMEARRHYCRNISKSLRQYGIKMKKDYPDAYENLCLYVEKNVPFKPLTVYGNKDSKIVACKIMPEGYTSTTLI